MDELFAIYAAALPRVAAWADEQFPGDGLARARTRARSRPRRWTCCAACCPPPRCRTWASTPRGQTYEQLILHLLAHPLPEARRYGGWILEARPGGDAELRRARRAPRPRRRVDRATCEARDARRRRAGCARLGLGDRDAARRRRAASVRLLHVDGDEDALLAALLFEAAGASEEETRIRLAALSGRRARRAAGRPRRRAAPTAATGPGRGFEALRYRFEIVSDYGAFRDLQRHRMLTVQWQRLTPAPRRRRARGGRRRRAAATTTAARSSVSRPSGSAWPAPGREREALYALCLGYRIRYVLDLNAREAMQLIELRSGREGHPSYRAVAHEMHRLIGAGAPGRRRRDDATSTPRPSRGWSASSARCARRRGSTRCAER